MAAMQTAKFEGCFTSKTNKSDLISPTPVTDPRGSPSYIKPSSSLEHFQMELVERHAFFLVLPNRKCVSTELSALWRPAAGRKPSAGIKRITCKHEEMRARDKE